MKERSKKLSSLGFWLGSGEQRQYRRRFQRDKLRPFVDVGDINAMRGFTGVGRHLTRFFFMSATEYYESLGDYVYPVVKYPGFRQFLATIMGMTEFEDAWTQSPASAPVELVDMTQPFDRDAYIRANTDVGRSGMNPTVHYCLFGFREKRRLRDEDAS